MGYNKLNNINYKKMESFNRKAHWENIYRTKALETVSWYQPDPHTSLEFIRTSGISKTAAIIDIGGGDSFLADRLLEAGYENITVLDISQAAIDRARARLKEKAQKIKWIVADVTGFQPETKYDFWHDRAAFHFLTEAGDIAHYKQHLEQALSDIGTAAIGTFSDQGPTKCSGIEIRQYSAAALEHTFFPAFEKIRCMPVEHKTPSGAVQHFIFCSFRKK